MSAKARRLFKEAREREIRDFAIATPKKPTVGEQERLMGRPEDDAKDIEFALVMHPELEAQLTRPGSSLTGNSILREVHEDRLLGKIAPFTPGPIGAYSRRPAPVLYTLSNWPELARKEMLELRAKNDAALAALEARL
jgi:hypothetical protein